MSSEKGQTLLEVIAAAAVGILVVSALTFATIFSLRNATFAKNSTQATKLAQEGIERVRSIRDRDSAISTDIDYPGSSRKIDKFSELFSVDLAHTICNTIKDNQPVDSPCYFGFDSGNLTKPMIVDETIDSFKRRVLIGDQTATKGSEKTVTLLVTWTDFAGPHESRLTTILRKL